MGGGGCCSDCIPLHPPYLLILTLIPLLLQLLLLLRPEYWDSTPPGNWEQSLEATDCCQACVGSLGLSG